MEEGKYIVILGAGDFPASPEALAVLQNAEYLCCCDDAGKEYIERWRNGALTNCRFPDAIVGDGDSLPENFKERYADIYHQVDEQDYNDLTKATRFIINHFTTSEPQNLITSKPQNLKTSKPQNLTIHYLGVTGKREDHTLGNIGLMAYYHHTFGITPILVTDYGTFTVHRGDSTLKTFPRQQVSIFNLSCKQMTSKHLKWDTYPYEELWQGTLNEALGDEVEFAADGEYIVFRTHLPKK